MNTELTGLIRMTAHDVVRGYACTMIVAGAIVAAVSLTLALCVALSDRKHHRLRFAAIMVACAVAGTALVFAGSRQPRKRILYCCASGPVSLEAVAVKYDIIGVDGKLLTLAER